MVNRKLIQTTSASLLRQKPICTPQKYGRINTRRLPTISRASTRVPPPSARAKSQTIIKIKPPKARLRIGRCRRRRWSPPKGALLLALVQATQPMCPTKMPGSARRHLLSGERISFAVSSLPNGKMQQSRLVTQAAVSVAPTSIMSHLLRSASFPLGCEARTAREQAMLFYAVHGVYLGD